MKRLSIYLRVAAILAFLFCLAKSAADLLPVAASHIDLSPCNDCSVILLIVP